MILTQSDKDKISYWALWATTRILLPLLFLAWVLLFIAHRGAANLLEPLRWYGTVEYESVSAHLDGSATFEDVTFTPEGAKPEQTVRAKNVEVTTPGMIWLIKTAFVGSGENFAGTRDVPGGSPKLVPKAASMSWRFSEINYSEEPFAIGKTAWLGWRSGIPFESLGCGELTNWNEKAFKKFAMSAQPQTLLIKYRNVAPDTAIITMKLSRPETASMEYELTAQHAESMQFYNLDWQQFAVVSQRWTLQDSGFVRARNRHCARLMSMSPAAYVDYHVEQVNTLMNNHGYFATQPLIEQYKEFVKAGGQLDWNSKPAGTVPFIEVLNLSSQARMDALRASFKPADLASVPFMIDVIATDPIQEPPSGTQIASTIDKQPINPSKTDPLSTTNAKANLPELDPREKIKKPVILVNDKPSVPPVEKAKNQLPKNPNANAKNQPVRVTDATVKPIVAVPKPVMPKNSETNSVENLSSTQSSSALAKTTPLVRGAPRNFDDLERFIGRRIVVSTTNGTIRVGRVKTYTPYEIDLYAEINGTIILLSIPRGQVKQLALP